MRVTGTLRLFDVDLLEPRDADYEDVFGAFRRRPSILATDVSPLRRGNTS